MSLKTLPPVVYVRSSILHSQINGSDKMNKEKLIYAPRTRAFETDAHSFYRVLRQEDPVHWSEEEKCWVLTRFDDVNSVLKDERFGRADSYRISAKDDASMNLVERFRSNLIAFKDAGEHTRMRTVMNELFSKRLAQVQPQMEAIAKNILEEFLTKDSIDIVNDFAFPFTVEVMSTMLGVPLEDKVVFKRYTGYFSSLFAPDKTEEDFKKSVVIIEEMQQYFRVVLAKKEEEPSDDLLSDLLHVAKMSKRLTDDEVLVMPIFLIFAGHETSMNLIANGMYALLQQEEEFHRLQSDLQIMTTAVEELLRFTSTSSALYRVALEDVMIGGKTISKGQEVVAVLTAANRDPERFSEPDRLDLTRKQGPHVAFGNGIHHCLGSSMARMEAKVAFTALLEAFAKMRLKEEPEWKESFVFPGLKSLHVSI